MHRKVIAIVAALVVVTLLCLSFLVPLASHDGYTQDSSKAFCAIVDMAYPLHPRVTRYHLLLGQKADFDASVIPHQATGHVCQFEKSELFL